MLLLLLLIDCVVGNGCLDLPHESGARSLRFIEVEVCFPLVICERLELSFLLGGFQVIEYVACVGRLLGRVLVGDEFFDLEVGRCFESR